MKRYKRSFASDNNAITHPKVMEALMLANQGHFISYGDDPYTQSALATFKEVFGQDTETYFVFNGTGANVLGLSALGLPHQAVICAETAHIHVDECGAPERFTGCKLLTVKNTDGKLRPEDIAKTLHVLGSEHHSQPAVVSITQSTELGTVYTIDEIKVLTAYAHEHKLFVHMDGARLANAAAALDCPLKSVTADVGIDVLSFGGTKNGLMLGEAVVFFQPDIAKNFKYIRKQGMQLASKMRYIAAQFEALLKEDLWLSNARKANAMARLLRDMVSDIPGIRLTQPVEANGVFATIPKDMAGRLLEEYFFYFWDEAACEVRWMTNFDTEESDVIDFVEAIKAAL